MIRIAPYLAGGFAAILALDYVPAVVQYLSSPAVAMSGSTSAAPKGDRLAPAQSQQHIQDGRELVHSDPVNNVTVVTKGVGRPDVTIHQQASSRVREVPVRPMEEARDIPSERSLPTLPVKPRKMPVGCESSFSPVASPAMAHHMGRCVS